MIKDGFRRIYVKYSMNVEVETALFIVHLCDIHSCPTDSIAKYGKYPTSYIGVWRKALKFQSITSAQ